LTVVIKSVSERKILPCLVVSTSTLLTSVGPLEYSSKSLLNELLISGITPVGRPQVPTCKEKRIQKGHVRDDSSFFYILYHLDRNDKVQISVRRMFNTKNLTLSSSQITFSYYNKVKFKFTPNAKSP